MLHARAVPAPGRWLDLAGWPRAAHYELFRTYDHPFFSVTTEVRVTQLHRRSRESGGPSFFLASLYASTRASNSIEEFRLRLRAEGVWLHERVHAGSTVLRQDGTFGFAYFDERPDLASFVERGRAEIARVERETGMVEPRDERDDLVHHSVLPWIRFTGFTHARRQRPLDSVPKVVFGKHFERDGERWMPVAVDVHHALADGLHVAKWLERFEAELAAV
jgi:chloramphenicol O-acetyltransferase type A